MKQIVIATFPVKSQAAADALLKKLRANGVVISFEGSFEDKEVPPDYVDLFVHYDENDELPLFVTNSDWIWKRELSADEADLIQSTGVVKEISHTHPRADKNGAPICAISDTDVWKATCSYLGFHPCRQMFLYTNDSGDDSVGHYKIALKVPLATYQAVEGGARKVLEAVTDATGFDDALAQENLSSALSHYSEKTSEDLAKDLQEKEIRFESAGGRGVDLACSIDLLRSMVAMRKVLDAA